MILGINDQEYYDRTKEFTSAFGEFAFNFENVCFIAKQVIESIFHQSGISKESKLPSILMYDSTAYPISKYLNACLIEYYQNELANSKDSKDRLSLLSKKLNAALELRNNLIHADWGIGYSVDEIPSADVAIGFKDKISKDGFKQAFHFYKPADFKKAANELKVIWMYLVRIEERIKNNESFWNKDEDIDDGLSELEFNLIS